MSSNDPVQHKKLGSSLKVGNEWAKQRETVMSAALELKFKQNDHLQKFLLSTNTKMLVTVNLYDPFWRTGLTLNETRANESECWAGRNTLGRMMENFWLKLSL